MTSDSSVVSGYAEKRCKVTTINQNRQISVCQFVRKPLKYGQIAVVKSCFSALSLFLCCAEKHQLSGFHGNDFVSCFYDVLGVFEKVSVWCSV